MSLKIKRVDNFLQSIGNIVIFCEMPLLLRAYNTRWNTSPREELTIQIEFPVFSKRYVPI